MAALVVLVGARWLRYSTWSETPVVNGALREILVVDGQVFLWTWAYSRVMFPAALLALALIVVGLHRRLPGRVVRRAGGLWTLTPLGTSMVLGAMVWVHYLFDLNPNVARLCAASLVLASAGQQLRLFETLPRAVVPAAWSLFFAAWLVTGGDPIERLTIVVWAAVLLITARLALRVGRREVLLLRMLAIVPMNLLPAALPLVAAVHGGTRLGDGLAYDFCEVPGRARLFATVPVCDSVRTDYDDCRDGHVVEYDLHTLQRVGSYDLFSPGLYGRLEVMVCLRDEVQVAVQSAKVEGRPVGLITLSLPVASPKEFKPTLGGHGLGATIAYDEGHDALFYSAEFSNLIVRYDRRTQQFDDTASQDLLHRWNQPVSLEEFNGSLCLHTGSIHPGRNRIYVADWMQGRAAYAIDLTTRRVVARYDVGGGGALGVAVDAERDRLFVSSLWGIEVFDLKTDRLIARKRTGLGNRPVVIDAPRNRLYLSSTVEGKIRILDRDTLDVMGQIPVGVGSRYVHLSADGQYLFGSSASAHYAWKADDLPGR